MSKKTEEQELITLLNEVAALYNNADQDTKWKVEAIQEYSNRQLPNFTQRDKRRYQISIQKRLKDILEGKTGYIDVNMGSADENVFGYFDNGEVDRIANETVRIISNNKKETPDDSTSIHDNRSYREFDFDRNYDTTTASIVGHDNDKKFKSLVGSLTTELDEIKQLDPNLTYVNGVNMDKINTALQALLTLQDLNFNEENYLKFLDVAYQLGIDKNKIHAYFNTENNTQNKDENSVVIGDYTLTGRNALDYQDNGWVYISDPTAKDANGKLIRGKIFYNGKVYNSIKDARDNISSNDFKNIEAEIKKIRDEKILYGDVTNNIGFFTNLPEWAKDNSRYLDLTNYYSGYDVVLADITGINPEDLDDFNWWDRKTNVMGYKDGKWENISTDASFNWHGNNPSYFTNVDTWNDNLNTRLGFFKHPEKYDYEIRRWDREAGYGYIPLVVSRQGGWGKANDLDLWVKYDSNGNKRIDYERYDESKLEDNGYVMASEKERLEYLLDNWGNTENKWVNAFLTNHVYNVKETKGDRTEQLERLRAFLSTMYHMYKNSISVKHKQKLIKLYNDVSLSLGNVSSNKLGGVIMAAKGNLLSLEQKEELKKQEEEASKENVIKDLELQQTAAKKLEGWTTNDTLRLSESLGLLISVISSFIPGYGTVASAVTGYGSTIAGAFADFADPEMSTADAWKELGINLGLDTIGLIPGAKLAKVGKIGQAAVKSIKKAIEVGIIGSGATGLVQDIIDMTQNPEKVDAEDWMLLATRVLSLTKATQRSVTKYRNKATVKSDKVYKVGDKEISKKQYKEVEKLVKNKPEEAATKLKELGVEDATKDNVKSKMEDIAKTSFEKMTVNNLHLPKEALPESLKNLEFSVKDGKLVPNMDLDFNTFTQNKGQYLVNPFGQDHYRFRNWLNVNRGVIDPTKLNMPSSMPSWSFNSDFWYLKEGGKLSYKNIF